MNYKISLDAMSGYTTPSVFTATAQLTFRSVALQYAKVVSTDLVFDRNVSSPSNITGYNQDAVVDLLSLMRSCLVKKTADNKATVCYLKDIDRNYYYDNTPAVLTGTEGDVMVYLPVFYAKLSNMEGNKRKCSIAATQIDSSYKKYGGYLIGAYKAHATGNKLYSRSGITPTASVSQTGFINYANARGGGFDIIDYEMHRAIAFLFYAKYGNRSSRAVLGTGGLSYGSGQTGTTNALGNRDTAAATAGAVNFQGLEAVHGWYYEWVSKVAINNRVWTITDSDRTTRTVAAGASDGWITDMAAMGDSEYLDVTPIAAGGSDTTYFSDYYYQSTGTGRVLARSSNSSSADGGVACADAGNGSSSAGTSIGSRLAFRGEISEAESVAAFKALPAL
ncbi:hypothetical protein Barb6XT_02799 [Bacteroidales bacterium Barb6XT]|nr:hypothetical protein Barb6XT_02799 [Bacteroidales bacterium Barb6XT]